MLRTMTTTYEGIATASARTNTQDGAGFVGYYLNGTSRKVLPRVFLLHGHQLTSPRAHCKLPLAADPEYLWYLRRMLRYERGLVCTANGLHKQLRRQCTAPQLGHDDLVNGSS